MPGSVTESMSEELAEKNKLLLRERLRVATLKGNDKYLRARTRVCVLNLASRADFHVTMTHNPP